MQWVDRLATIRPLPIWRKNSGIGELTDPGLPTLRLSIVSPRAPNVVAQKLLAVYEIE